MNGKLHVAGLPSLWALAVVNGGLGWEVSEMLALSDSYELTIKFLLVEMGPLRSLSQLVPSRSTSPLGVIGKGQGGRGR